MKYARLSAGPDGASHFDDVTLEMKAGAVSSDLTDLIPVAGIMFLRYRRGAMPTPSWHHAPRRQFVITLAGEVEVTASDGETRRFGPGGVLFVEDLTGKGHLTRPLGTELWRALFLPLAGEDVSAPPGAPPPAEPVLAYSRIVAGADGDSRFEEVEVPAASISATGMSLVSALIPARGVFFRRSPAAYHYDLHTAPRRQFVITLAGAVEIVTNTGDARRFGPGSVLLAADTTGKGHISRGASTTERLSAFVTLD